MTNRERIAHPCPKCHAIAGAPCLDPIGEPTRAPHKVRGPGEHERHLAERIARQTAREKASYGPMFAYLADVEVIPPTVAEVMERDRRAHAQAFDQDDGPDGVALLRQCNKGLECVYLWHLKRELGRLAGEPGRIFAESVMTTYPLDYGRMIFQRFFTTTERKQLGPYRVPADNSIGFTIGYRFTWEPAAPLMTAAEFDRLYPKPNHYRGDVDAEEPDDGGLFARTIGTLTRG